MNKPEGIETEDMRTKLVIDTYSEEKTDAERTVRYLSKYESSNKPSLSDFIRHASQPHLNLILHHLKN